MKFSSFLNEQQQAMAEPIVRKSGAQYRFYGGFPGAQRQMLGVFPDHMEPLDDYFPLKAFTFRYPDNYHLSHRDFLGTLMAQQIKRETIGDIVITSGKAFLFAEERVQKVVATQIDKVGGVGVTVEQGVDGPVTAVQKFRELKGTLASLRLDASVSLVTGLSREKAAKLNYKRHGDAQLPGQKPGGHAPQGGGHTHGTRLRKISIDHGGPRNTKRKNQRFI